MSNSKGSLVIPLPAYNSLNRILRLSFLMILTVGDLRLGPQKEQTQPFIRVYLNLARHFPVINKSITQSLTIHFLFAVHNFSRIFFFSGKTSFISISRPALMVIQGLTNQFNLYKLISPEFFFEVFKSMTSIF